MRATHVTLIAAIGLVLAGCAHEPTIDIDAADHAIEEARQAQAPEYAPASWTAAQDAKSKLEGELDAQSNRWIALRNYTTSRQLALDVKAAAERSKDEAAAGREKAKTEATTLVAQAREEGSRAHAALAEAPRGKGTEADLASLKTDTESVDGTIADMQRAFDAGDYVDAKTKAQAAIDAAKAIETELEKATIARRSATRS